MTFYPDGRETFDNVQAIYSYPGGGTLVFSSIIGNHKMSEPLEESTDTVVDYWSSHLNDAASESVVDATHLDILRDDAAIEELRRLLYLHAGLKYRR